MASSGLGNRSLFVERAKILNLDTKRTDSSMYQSFLSNWVGEWKYTQFDPINNKNIDIILSINSEGIVNVKNFIEGRLLMEPQPMTFTILNNMYGLLAGMDLSMDSYIIQDPPLGKYKALKTELYLDPSLNKVGVQFTFIGSDTTDPNWEAVLKPAGKIVGFSVNNNGDSVSPLQIFERQ